MSSDSRSALILCMSTAFSEHVFSTCTLLPLKSIVVLISPPTKCKLPVRAGPDSQFMQLLLPVWDVCGLKKVGYDWLP